MEDEVQITVVPDAPCPQCGASSGGDPDYPNRPKVGDDKGTWWWKCYNPACPVSYYDPTTGRTQVETA